MTKTILSDNVRQLDNFKYEYTCNHCKTPRTTIIWQHFIPTPLDFGYERESLKNQYFCPYCGYPMNTFRQRKTEFTYKSNLKGFIGYKRKNLVLNFAQSIQKNIVEFDKNRRITEDFIIHIKIK